jgi:hypothetical protein
MRKASEKPLLALLEAGGVNDMPVIVEPAVPTSDALVEALKTVKEAGYRVSKPRRPKTFKCGKDRVGPSCITQFADNVTTRMSVCCSPTDLDWVRGERLAQAAWQSRWRSQQRIYAPYPVVEPVPPAIVAMRFEQDGVVLARRSNSEGAP